jgi:pilus assembly protein CpaF
MREESPQAGATRPALRLASSRRDAAAVVLGIPALDALLADGSVTEIMVNGPDDVWVERDGRLAATDVRLADEASVRRLIDRIVTPLGRRCDERSPMVDARLADGSRVHAIVPPLCLNGPTVTIRKFSRAPLTAADLVRRGSASPELMAFLRACVLGRVNVVVSGGTSTGKTTLLNVLSTSIPDDERIITIENAAELRLQQRHVIALESRPADAAGECAVTVRDLVVTALRMRPDRIVVGECRAGEALDMLQAMNTGHDGSLTTLHANSPRDALHRLETMVLMAGLDLPLRAVRRQLASAVQLVVHLERLQDGSRRIVRVTEVAGMEGDVVTTSDLFTFRHDGMREGRVEGRLVPTGVRPAFLAQLERRGVAVPARVFGS